MRTWLRLLLPLAVLALVARMPASAGSSPYVACSLHAAERQLRAAGTGDERLETLGGMTVLAGFVWDAGRQDLIIVGREVDGLPPVTLSDLSVAFRAQIAQQESPLVSIDATPDTPRTRQQTIRYRPAGIEGSPLARDMVLADVVLKKLALARLQGAIWGVRPYLDLAADSVREGGLRDRIASRFWWKNRSPNMALRDDTCAILRLDVGVETEVVYAERNGQAVQDLAGVRDEVGDRFAASVEGSLDDLSLEYTDLTRVRPILALVAMAEGARILGLASHLSYWLSEYRVEHADTPATYELLESSVDLPDRNLNLTVTGGLDTTPLRGDLESGVVSAFREAVLSSRPSPDALLWHPPLEGWHIPGAERAEGAHVAQLTGSGRPGCSVERVVTAGIGSQVAALSAGYGLPPALPRPQATSFDVALGERPPVPRIGGVMLSGTAEVAGADGHLDLSDGGFSLVVDGANARVSDTDFARFVTALWAVYYCKEPPGISIDPIDPSVDRHLVRYIGQVINSDLGRVMREADYHMKKVVMGIERPAIPGFQTPEDWMAAHRELYLAYRRFWFVPEDMRFREGSGLLLYDGGSMRLRTELMSGDEPGQLVPADEAFAAFYTQHYAEFAEQYPIYGDLLEYAKMVALARYLKAQGVPLQWFLLANRDRVLTEDSPGTVVELARKSTHFQGVELKGGVDLGAQGRYVHDATALEAISAALVSRERAGRDMTTRPVAQAARGAAAPPTPAPAYTAVAQKSLTSGRDARGLRYQTDLAFRMDGEPALELVRYFDWRKGNHGMFGGGWDMLLPYRVTLSPEHRRIALEDGEIVGPAAASVLDLLSGEAEELDFDPVRYGILGYLPPEGSATKTIGLFVTGAGAAGAADTEGVPAYRLADKLGNEFMFDQRGLMTGAMLGEEHRLTYTYAREDTRTIVRPSVRLAPAPDTAPVQVGGFALPGGLVLTDMYGNTGLVLTAQPDGRYLPDRAADTSVLGGLFRTDGRFIMEDDEGNQVVFAPGGAVESISFSEQTNVVQSMRYERLEPVAREPGLVAPIPGQEVDFEFFVDLTGAVRVGRATVTCHAPEQTSVLHYEYDASGRLVGVSHGGAGLGRQQSFAQWAEK